MTLPTTRIDTLTPGQGHDPPSSLCTPSESSTQQILLSDFLEWSTNPNEGQDQDPLPLTTTPPRLMMGGVKMNSGSSGSTAPSLESPSDTTSASREVSFFTGPPMGVANVNAPSSFTPLTLPPSSNPPVQVQYRPNQQPQRGGFPCPEELNNFSLVNLSNEGLITSGDGEDLPMLRRKSRSRSQSSAGGGRGQGQHQQNLQSQHQQPKQAFYHHHNGNGHGHGVAGLPKGKKYSSSSEEDSDTGFLVRSGGNFLKANGSLRPEVVEPKFPSYPYQGGPVGRKKFRRRKNSGRASKGPRPGQNPEDSGFFACCLDEPEAERRSAASSLTGKYLRFSCAIILIIFITTFISILVSMQRKVDLLSAEVNQFKSAGSASLSISASTTPMNITPANSSLVRDLDQLNLTISSLSLKYADLSARLSSVEKQPSIEELRKDLAHLGSEMKGSIEEIQKDLNNMKQKIEENKNRSPGPPQGQLPSGAGAEPADKKGTEEGGSRATSN